MENMNPIEYLESLVELVINDNFEVLCNSIDIIDSLNGTVDEKVIQRCHQKINSALKVPTQVWRKEALLLLLEEFEDE